MPGRYSPENPPPLRREGESVEDYRVRCGWDAPRVSAQHTPAPWSAIKWSCHAATSVVVDDPAAVTGRRLVAECETEEDALLVAATLELLDAVQAFMELDPSFTTDSLSFIEKIANGSSPDRELARVVLKARAALAKAGVAQ